MVRSREMIFIDKMTKRKTVQNLHGLFGADYGDRTRHLNLGKVALYQMS